MSRTAVVGCLAGVLLASAGAADATFPGRNGRIVFASARAIPGQPHADAGNGELFALDLRTHKRTNLSRNALHEYSAAWSRDGRLVAFLRGPNTDGGDVWVMQPDGRGQHRVARGPASPPVWSPDGSALAFAIADPANPGLFVVKPDGTGLRRLLDFPTREPAWSPDGRWIVFTASDAPPPALPRMGLVRPDGSGLRWLSGGSAFEVHPVWSPDSTRVAFIRFPAPPPAPDAGGPANVYVTTLATGETSAVTSYPTVELAPITTVAWSPDGRKLLYVRTTSEIAGSVRVVNADGGGDHEVAKGPIGATWSPDGKRLALASVRAGVTIRTMRLGSSKTTLFLRESPANLLSDPAWSPNGKRLIVSTIYYGYNDRELFTVEPDGTRLHQLTRNRVDDFDPAWSPDGRRIAFARGRIANGRVTRSWIDVMDANGRHVHRVTPRSVVATNPAWAPDGRRLAFEANGPVVAVIGVNRTNLHGVARGSDPAWSPDGQLIAFVDGTAVKTVSPNGRGARTLFDARGRTDVDYTQVSNPSWSPGGRVISFYLLYDHGKWTEETAMVVNRDGTNPHALAGGCSADGETWSPDGKWTAADGICVGAVGGQGRIVTQGESPDWQPLPR